MWSKLIHVFRPFKGYMYYLIKMTKFTIWMCTLILWSLKLVPSYIITQNVDVLMEIVCSFLVISKINKKCTFYEHDAFLLPKLQESCGVLFKWRASIQYFKLMHSEFEDLDLTKTSQSKIRFSQIHTADSWSNPIYSWSF